MIELELLNKITKRVQNDKPIDDVEKMMLLGVIKSVSDYCKQKEDISMLDVMESEYMKTVPNRALVMS